MVDKFITSTDLSKASGADCIPVVFRRTVSLKFYIIYLLDSSIYIWRNLVFKMYRRPHQTIVHLIFLLWLVKSLKNLIIGLLIKSRNMAFFSGFQCGFRFFWPTADLLTVVSDRSWVIQVVPLYISKVFNKHASLLHKLHFMLSICPHFLFLVPKGLKLSMSVSLCKNTKLMLEFLKTPSWSYTFPKIH